MAAAARPSVARYDWSYVARQVMHVYRRLAEGHRAHLCAGERHLRDDRQRLRIRVRAPRGAARRAALDGGEGDGSSDALRSVTP